MPARVLLQTSPRAGVRGSRRHSRRERADWRRPQCVNPSCLPAYLSSTILVIVDEFGRPRFPDQRRSRFSAAPRRRYAVLALCSRNVWPGFKSCRLTLASSIRSISSKPGSVVFTTISRHIRHSGGPIPTTTISNGPACCSGAWRHRSKARHALPTVSLTHPACGIGFRLSGQLSEGATADGPRLTVTQDSACQGGSSENSSSFYGRWRVSPTSGRIAPRSQHGPRVMGVDYRHFPGRYQERCANLEFTGRAAEPGKLVRCLYEGDRSSPHTRRARAGLQLTRSSSSLADRSPACGVPRRPQPCGGDLRKCRQVC